MADRVLIRRGTIVSLDPQVGTLFDADLLIEDGAIVAIADGIEADAEEIDASGAVVTPGLVDAHRHLWYETVRGMAMDSSLAALHRDIWSAVAVHYTPADVHAATRAAIVAALDAGITTVLDWCHIVNTPEHGEEAIRAHAELPIRSLFAYGASIDRKLAELHGRSADRGDTAAATLAGRLRGGGARTTFLLALQGPESASMASSAREIAVARELGLPMSMHVGIRAGVRPRRSVARLAAASLLGDDMQFVHCCTTSASELAQIAAAGAHVVVCPAAEMALGIGVPPTARARDRGLLPALGTDAVCCASGDLFDEARLAMLVARSQSAASTRDVLAAITLDAARACWLDREVGSLRVGKRADLVLLRGLHIPSAGPVDVQAAIIASAHAHNVDTVIVDGEIVKRDGALCGIDRAAVDVALADSRRELFARAGLA